MLSLLKTAFEVGLKLLVMGFILLYVTLVIMTYRTDGSRYQPRLNLRDPARSIESLLIWLGVKAFSATVTLGRRFFEILSETSADLGEWFIHRRRREVRESVRSRFLI